MTLDQLPVVSNRAGFRLCPPGTYLVELVGIDEEENPQYERPTAVFRFRVLRVLKLESDDPNDQDAAAEWVGREIRAWVGIPQALTPRTTMRKYVEALLGRPLEEGERPRVSQLIGRRARATVEHYYTRDGKLSHRIEKLVKSPSKISQVMEEE